MNRPTSYDGWCVICGNYSIFKDINLSIRETYNCNNCFSSLRERVTANGIITAFGHGKCNKLIDLVDKKTFFDLNIFEPGVAGAYRSILSNLPYYEKSFFFENIPLGEYVDGVRNEDLQNLTHLNDSFDLVITSDIFEHIRKPFLAFAEIFRVLKPNGVHVFSIPVTVPMKTITEPRVDVSGPIDINILEPVYHGNGKGGKSIVYNDFGSDIFYKLEACGFKTLTVSDGYDDAQRARVISFISIAIKK